MAKKQMYFHLTILIAAVVIGMWSIWEDGLISEGKNHPNFTVIAMVLMVIGQFAGIKTYQSQKRKEP
jgi:succinate dehydrogenase hydrophobic anchor subunit